MARMDIKKEILKVLGKHREGLTFTQIATAVGKHRHTVTKYIFALSGAGELYIRDMGTLKLCYLEKPPSIEPAKIPKRTRGYSKFGIGKSLIASFFLLATFLSLVQGGLSSHNTPWFSNDAANSTIVGGPCNFTLDIQDPVQISSYIFSTNNTGEWINSTAVAVGSASIEGWNVTILNSTPGTLVQWKFYANDSSDNWNVSRTYNLTTQYIYIEVNLVEPDPLTANSSNPLEVLQYDVFVINATATCRGGNCGGVYGSVRYNTTGEFPDQLINSTAGGSPFYEIADNGLDLEGLTRNVSYGGYSRATGYRSGQQILEYKGNLHAIYIGNRTGFPTNYHPLVHKNSTDGGLTWSEPHRINNDVVGSYPGDSVIIEIDGMFHAYYHDDSEDLHYSNSTNEGQNWADGGAIETGTIPHINADKDSSNASYVVYCDFNQVYNNFMRIRYPNNTWTSETQLTDIVRGYRPKVFISDNDTIHFYVLRFNVTNEEGFYYMKSGDGGQTWTTVNGTPITLPGTISTMDKITTSTEVVYGGKSLYADSNDIPWLVYTNRSGSDRYSRIAYWNETTESWERKYITINISFYSFWIDSEDRFYLVGLSVNDSDTDTEVYTAYSDDKGDSWVIDRVTENSGVEADIVGTTHLMDVKGYYMWREFESGQGNNNPQTVVMNHINVGKGNTQYCGNLNEGDSCSLNWTVNATGPLNTFYTIDVNFSSTVLNDTGNAHVKISPLKLPVPWDNSTSSEYAGESVSFNIRWTRETALSGYIFSFDNGTGVLQNDSWAAFPLGACPSPYTECWSNVTKIVNSTNMTFVRWKVYANDSYNRWNATYDYNFTAITADIPPLLTSVSPTQGEKIYTRWFWANMSSNEELHTVLYSFDGAANQTLNKLNDKYFYKNISSYFSPHNITFYGNDTNGTINRTSTITFTLLSINASVLEIEVIPSLAWWNDSILVIGNAFYENGSAIPNGDVEITLDSVPYCLNTTNSRGSFNCTFFAPTTLGSYTLMANVTKDDESFTNTTTLDVKIFYGSSPIGKQERVVYEVPMVVQDVTGEIKRVLVKIFVWR